MSTDNPLYNLNLTSHLLRRGDFQPVEGGALTIMLPGEQISSIVHKVVTPDQVIAQIATKPFGRTGHNYELGDMVAVVRQPNALGGEDWVAQSFSEPAVAPVFSKPAAAQPLLPRSIDPALAPGTAPLPPVAPKTAEPGSTIAAPSAPADGLESPLGRTAISTEEREKREKTRLARLEKERQLRGPTG